MPRKKQKGPPPRSNRPSPSKPGPSSQPKAKGSKQDSGAAKDAQKKAPAQANQRPIVPFLRGDRILLIGEGEFLEFAFFFVIVHCSRCNVLSLTFWHLAFENFASLCLEMTPL